MRIITSVLFALFTFHLASELALAKSANPCLRALSQFKKFRKEREKRTDTLASFHQYRSLKLRALEEHKWKGVQKLLKRSLKHKEKIAAALSFEVGLGEFGQDGINRVGYGLNESVSFRGDNANLTDKQKSKKVELLKSGGFKESEVKKIMQHPAFNAPSLEQNEKISKTIARQKKWRKTHLSRFQTLFKPDATFKKLPGWKGKGKLPYHKAYDRVRFLLSSQNRVMIFEYMQQLELEVIMYSVLTGKTPAESLPQVLALWEKSAGFLKSQKLKQKVYTAKSWRVFIRQGAMPMETALKVKHFFGLNEDFDAHGAYSHRVQMHLILRDMNYFPQFYDQLGTKRPGYVFWTTMGQENFIRNCDWSDSPYRGFDDNGNFYPGSRVLLDALFEGDGYQHDFHSPIFVAKAIADPRYVFWPGLMNIFY